MNDEHQAVWRWSWLLTLSSGVMVAFGTMFYAMSVLLTEEAAGGVFSTTTLSVGFGGLVLVGGGLAFVIGKQADRRGVRTLTVIGFALGAVGLLAFGRSREPWQVIAVSWLLLGPAGGLTFYEPAFVAIDQWFGRHHRARALGVLTVVGGLAGPIFLPVTERLVTVFGWRPTTAILAGVMAATGVAAALLLPDHVPPPPVQSVEGKVRLRLGADPRFVWFTLAMLLSFGAFQSVFFHRIAVFEAAGFTVATVTAWGAVSSLLSFPGRYAGPIVAVRTGGLPVYAASAGLAAGAVLLMVGGTGWRMPAHFTLFGLTFGAMLPIRAVVMAQWYSGPRYGEVMGTQWSVTAVAGAGFPALVGWLRDVLDGYDTPMVIVSVLFILAALSALAAGVAAKARS